MELPGWLIERLKVVRPVDEAQPEPELRVDVDTDAYYGWVECPECGHRYRVPAHLVLADDYVVEGHRDRTLPGQQTCVVGGWHVQAARDMVRMRYENNGRLLRAAHP